MKAGDLRWTDHARTRAAELWGPASDEWLGLVLGGGRPLEAGLVAALTQRALERCRDHYVLSEDQAGIFVVEQPWRKRPVVVTVLRLSPCQQALLAEPAADARGAA